MSFLRLSRYDFAAAAPVHGRYQPGFLHGFDQARRAIVANAQMALNQRDRSAAVLENDLYSLIVQRVGLAIAAISIAVATIARLVAVIVNTGA